ncbi:hypothetical protein KSP40_PGU016583 [Platanthera guangdongensis]|uniref:Uncharacterized protein n=1 Tax=Platanthera guangdongensis TaxID=2320717 RepID=A0ABR2MKD4_9ASPA
MHYDCQVTTTHKSPPNDTHRSPEVAIRRRIVSLSEIFASPSPPSWPLQSPTSLSRSSTSSPESAAPFALRKAKQIRKAWLVEVS